MAVVLAVSVPLLGGCASFQSLEPPRVRLTAVELIEAGLLEQRYGFKLRVQNPNDVSLPVKALSYEIRLAGAEFANGSSTRKFELPALGEQEVELEASTNLLATLQHLASWWRSSPQELDYEIAGKVQIGLPLVGALPFSASGAVPLTAVNP